MSNENNGWIRVEDMLPQHRDLVLVFDSKNNVQMVALCEYEFDGDFCQIDCSHWENDRGDWLEEPDCYEITHWRQLPAPPIID